jgi:hypothetical protein
MREKWRLDRETSNSFIETCFESDIWSQASYRYAILWEVFLDPSDSYFLFADFVDFSTHWTYMLIFRHIFLSNYWWQKSEIWSQASYRYSPNGLVKIDDLYLQEKLCIQITSWYDYLYAWTSRRCLPLQMHLSRCQPRGVHLHQVRNILCIVVNKRKIQRDSVLIIRLITDKTRWTVS